MSLFASSSSSNSSSVEYEVFISFRGSDTRHAFISHLREALGGRTIVTFIDEELRRGDEISPALSNAIKKSQVAVVIFSKDYASSKWCLNELVEILECKKEHRQIVIPVFYHVTPTHVRKQTESYERSFVEHKKKGIPVETLQKWRIALTEASNLSGYDTDVVRDEASLTKKIVDDIWKELRVKIDNKNLVGIESKVEEIISLLKMGSGNVCVVGIWGIGGIGKTTLASAVFNEIRIQFGGCCFLGNIRERSETADGLNGLRQQLYSAISGEKSGKIFDDVMLNFLLSRKKVLIVFDDVFDFKQIENIVGGVSGPNGESRFIITTRNRQVLRNCDCKEENIYEVKGLCDKEALQLFSRVAFKQEHPQEDYIELSKKMVDCAKGSPLALKVLGSHLYDKRQQVWESAIERLKKAPDQDIQCVLKVSFDGLDYEQKDVFLDVACFFKENFKENVVNLYDNGFEFTLDTLIDRCLVSIDSFGRITMHDLLQEMGLQIVREQSIENPGERSRLWHHDDIWQVLTRNESTRAIKGISFDTSKTKAMHLCKNPFINMSKLWFLNIYSSDYSSSGKILSCSEDFQCVSTKLRFLRWDYYPMKSLQSSFSLENLVILRMHFSKVEQLWNGVQSPPNLKEIDLSHCQNLTTISDLSLATKLEEIHLRDCENLTAIPDLPLALELLVINLSGCSNLTSLPPFDHLEGLCELDLSHCKKLVTIPELSCNISDINLSETGITHLPSSIGNQWLLFSLDLSHCHELSFLPKEISNLKYIRSLCLSYCHKLQFLPDELPRSLKRLDARGCSSLNVVPYSLSILLATTEEVFFSGCYMLDKEKFTTIIQGALLGIQQLRFRERPAQAIKEDGKVSVVAYSGCEIPKIFEFQHLGSMISMELPYEMVGGKLVGLAFFFVYKPCERDEELGVEDEELEVQDTRLLSIKFHCKTTFENSECSLIRDKFKIRFSESVSKEAAEDDSTVVVVGYTNPSYHRNFPSHYQSILLELEFSLSCCEVALELAQLGWCSLPCCEVKKCGFKLFSGPLSEEEGKGTSSTALVRRNN